MTPTNALDALARKIVEACRARSNYDDAALAAVLGLLSKHAITSEAAAYEKAAKAICRYCEFADKPKSRWSKANSNGKHFDKEGVEQYCDAWPIRQLASPSGQPAPICPHCGVPLTGMNSNPDECLHKPDALAALKAEVRRALQP